MSVEAVWQYAMALVQRFRGCSTRHRMGLRRAVRFLSCSVALGQESCPALPVGFPFRLLCDPETFTALVHVPEAPFLAPAPVLLYLHGSGQSGRDILKTLEPPATGGPPVELHSGRATKLLAEEFVMVAPQTSHGWAPAEVGAFLDFLLRRGEDALGLQLDRQRVYITGHSIGGSAALQAAAELRSLRGRHRFAAVVPVASSSFDTSLRAYAGLHAVPVWLHHGANDIVAPVAVSDNIAAVLRVLNPGEGMLRYTRFEVAPTAPGRNPLTHEGHACPMLTYNNSELYEWLLQHSVPAV